MPEKCVREWLQSDDTLTSMFLYSFYVWFFFFCCFFCCCCCCFFCFCFFFLEVGGGGRVEGGWKRSRNGIYFFSFSGVLRRASIWHKSFQRDKSVYFTPNLIKRISGRKVSFFFYVLFIGALYFIKMYGACKQKSRGQTLMKCIHTLDAPLGRSIHFLL